MILIINKSKKDAQRLSEMLYFMGIVSYGASLTEAFSEISTSYSAVIVMNPNTLADKADFATRLRLYASLPIFAVTDVKDPTDDLIFDCTINAAPHASKILKYVTDYCIQRGLKPPGTYKLAGIDASAYLTTPSYYNKALPFTKTELMLLRTLIATYPTPINAKTILKYAFKPSKKPELSNVRTHVSVMNKKFREISERNIIALTPSEGYRVLTPELAEAIPN